MAVRLTVVALATATTLCLALIGALGSATAGAGGSSGACERWGDSGPSSLSNPQARAAILCLVNEERGKRGLPALDRDRRLQKAAQRHTDRMEGSGCFSHQCSGEASISGRLSSVGYLGGGLRRWAYAENIAWGMGGRGSPSAIVDAWMKSSGHRANILSRSFREIGVGFADGSPGSRSASGGIYTTDFGLAVG